MSRQWGEFSCLECDGDGCFECDDCFGSGEDECVSCGSCCECETCDGTGNAECDECEGTGLDPEQVDIRGWVAARNLFTKEHQKSTVFREGDIKVGEKTIDGKHFIAIDGFVINKRHTLRHPLPGQKELFS